jgi:hypothetical protein
MSALIKRTLYRQPRTKDSYKRNGSIHTRSIIWIKTLGFMQDRNMVKATEMIPKDHRGLPENNSPTAGDNDYVIISI